MAHILADCPHCGGQKVGFSSRADYPITHKYSWLVFFICGNCQQAIIVEYRVSLNRTPKQPNPSSAPGRPEDSAFEMIASYPTPSPSQIPDHVPTPLDRFFQQAADAFKRGDFDASGTMSRKVIDVSAQRQLGGDSIKFHDIYQRIEELAARGEITKDLKEWAHAVRLGAREAAHDEQPFSKDDAEDLLNMCELYLTYVYSLPGRLAERKARKATVVPLPKNA